MEEEKIYSVTEPVGSEQDAPVSNMEMLSDVFFKEEARRLKEAFCFERDADDLDYLNHQLQSVKNLLVGLKLPWIQIWGTERSGLNMNSEELHGKPLFIGVSEG